MENYNWIKVGQQCKWNDPYKFNDEDKIYTIVGIKFEDDSTNIYDDTIIELDNGFSFAEVYPYEIEHIPTRTNEYAENIVNAFHKQANVYNQIKDDLTTNINSVIKCFAQNNPNNNIEKENIVISWVDKFNGELNNGIILNIVMDNKYETPYIKTDIHDYVTIEELSFEQQLFLANWCAINLDYN